MRSNSKVSLVFILFLLSIFLVGLSAAQAPFQTENRQTGIDVRAPLVDVIKAGQDYDFDVHAYNITNGVYITSGLTCYMHLYSNNGTNLAVLNDSAVDSNGFDYDFLVKGANFTQGNYFVNFQCNSTAQGGASTIQFLVTATGTVLTTQQSIIYSLLFIIGIMLAVGLLIAGIFLPGGNKTDEMTGYVLAVSNMKYLKMFFLALSSLMIILVMYFGMQLSYAYLDLPFLYTLFNFGFITSIVLTLVLFIVGTFITIANVVHDSQVGEAIQRGLRVK